MLFIIVYRKYLHGDNTSKAKNEKINTLREEINTNNMRGMNEELKIISQNLETISNYIITSN